jgi:integrase
MHLVLVENDVSAWQDETGVKYHFPKKYARLIQPGNQFVYYKGGVKDKAFSTKRLSDDPHYFGAGHCYATHASNALKNWLKKDFGGLTAHCLRHTFRDRLRAVECPMDMIDQIGGWRSVGGVGASYGEGYPANILAKQMAKACINI